MAIAARKHLEEQGYTVERIVLSPSPDRLLRNKLGDDLIPLETRAEIARLSMADLGLDVEVSTGPGIEAENTEGKVKRTQLANWAAKQYPGTSIVNITGADQPVSGTPSDESSFPAVYTGTGETHGGYFYISMPREIDTPNAKSSGAIRKTVATRASVTERLYCANG